MSRIKYAVDSKHTRPWVDRVGKLVVNFSAVELECVHWILQMSEDTGNLKTINQMQYTARARAVMCLVERRKLNDTWRKRALRAWNQSLVLAKVRNQVAHNPVIFGWSSGREVGVPDIVGVPAVRDGVSRKGEVLLSIASADKAINEIASVATQLKDLREEWCAARDKGQVPPAPIKARRASRTWSQLAENLRSALGIRAGNA